MSSQRANSKQRSRSLPDNPTPILAVFCSGEGTNLQAILRAIEHRQLRARIGVVVSDNPTAFCLERARNSQIPTVVVDPKGVASRQAFDRVLSRVVDSAKARLIVLAGFMRILSSGFIRRYPQRILNIHPALLPAFPGTHAVRDALRYGTKITGVTVHFVDEKVDHGPIILQEAVPVKEEDTEESLRARIHRVEHRLYPRAIQMVLDGEVEVIGRKVLCESSD